MGTQDVISGAADQKMRAFTRAVRDAWAAQIEPPLTTVHLPVARMGEAAARALVAHLDDGEPIRPVEVTGHLVERDSTAGPLVADRR